MRQSGSACTCAPPRSAGAPHHSARCEQCLCSGQSEQHRLEDRGWGHRLQMTLWGSQPCPELLQSHSLMALGDGPPFHPSWDSQPTGGISVAHPAAGQLAVPTPCPAKLSPHSTPGPLLVPLGSHCLSSSGDPRRAELSCTTCFICGTQPSTWLTGLMCVTLRRSVSHPLICGSVFCAGHSGVQLTRGGLPVLPPHPSRGCLMGSIPLLAQPGNPRVLRAPCLRGALLESTCAFPELAAVGAPLCINVRLVGRVPLLGWEAAVCHQGSPETTVTPLDQSVLRLESVASCEHP